MVTIKYAKDAYPLSSPFQCLSYGGNNEEMNLIGRAQLNFFHVVVSPTGITFDLLYFFLPRAVC
jgi:hypothetical protein